MAINTTFDGQSLRTTHLLQKGSLAVLAASAALILSFGRNNTALVGVLLALYTVIAPAVYMLGKRMLIKVRQRETEARLIRQTKAFLENQPQEWALLSQANSAIAGRRLMMQDFCRYPATAAPLPAGEPTVFQPVPRHEAVQNLYEQHFADAASKLLVPVCTPWGELLE